MVTTSGMTPRETAQWIVSEWRSVQGSDRLLVIAITEALKVVPAVVAEMEAENAARERLIAQAREALRGFLTLREWVIDAGGTKGPLAQDIIDQFARMQHDIMEQARAALAAMEPQP